VDNPEQIQFLEEFEKARGSSRRWSVFVKIDGGQRYGARFYTERRSKGI
jgi:D-serine deaminase-like pyridoxal phosphate-dependent protein